MRLVEAIKEGKLKLTENEMEALQAIRDEGSFFEEGGGNVEVREVGICFFGWEIYKSDVANKFNPAGVISSLVKKGVLEAIDDDGTTAYYIKYELDFAEDDKYKIIFS